MGGETGMNEWKTIFNSPTHLPWLLKQHQNFILMGNTSHQFSSCSPLLVCRFFLSIPSKKIGQFDYWEVICGCGEEVVCSISLTVCTHSTITHDRFLLLLFIYKNGRWAWKAFLRYLLTSDTYFYTAGVVTDRHFHRWNNPVLLF